MPGKILSKETRTGANPHGTRSLHDARRSFGRDGRTGLAVRAFEITLAGFFIPMTPIYTIGAIIALGLMVYLIIALLKPEWYS